MMAHVALITSLMVLRLVLYLLTSRVPSFQLAGNYNSGSFNNGGSNGNYWSSTANSSTNAYNLNFNSGNVNSANNNNRRNGFSVRCILSEVAEP